MLCAFPIHNCSIHVTLMCGYGQEAYRYASRAFCSLVRAFQEDRLRDSCEGNRELVKHASEGQSEHPESLALARSQGKSGTVAHQLLHLAMGV